MKKIILLLAITLSLGITIPTTAMKTPHSTSDLALTEAIGKTRGCNRLTNSTKLSNILNNLESLIILKNEHVTNTIQVHEPTNEIVEIQSQYQKLSKESVTISETILEKIKILSQPIALQKRLIITLKKEITQYFEAQVTLLGEKLLLLPKMLNLSKKHIRAQQKELKILDKDLQKLSRYFNQQ